MRATILAPATKGLVRRIERIGFGSDDIFENFECSAESGFEFMMAYSCACLCCKGDGAEESDEASNVVPCFAKEMCNLRRLSLVSKV